MAATAPLAILSDPLIRHEYQGDSSTTAYLRKQPEDAKVKQLVAARGKGWKPRTLTFPYHEVTPPGEPRSIPMDAAGPVCTGVQGDY